MIFPFPFSLRERPLGEFLGAKAKASKEHRGMRRWGGRAGWQDRGDKTVGIRSAG